jgi:tRNA-dihydrouridine synthase B
MVDLTRIAKNRIFLAPMAGVTDKAFREVCASSGAGFTYTEMVSAKGIQYGSRRTESLIAVSAAEGKAGVQLFGSEPDVLADTAKFVCEHYLDRIALIDINMGCPAQKIVRNDEGCALMQNPPLAAKIIGAVKKASLLPVTVKFRKGWDEKSLNATAFAKMAEESGADALTVHGRTRMEFYGGKADLSAIAEVKAAVGIPVIGSGDVFSADAALNMFQTTGCDALMVARGALGNPFVFREILAALQGKRPEPPDLREKAETALYHLRLAVADKGERRAVREFRKHAAWYLKGVKNAAKLRESAVKASTQREMEELFFSFLSE